MIIILYIAALIAAIALFIIAIYLGKTLKSTSQTLDEVKESLDKITVEVQGITGQATKMLDKTNVLIDDVNGKISKIDPVFDAVGDIGTSLFGLSKSIRELAELATDKVDENDTKIAKALSASNSLFAFRNKLKSKKAAKDAAEEANKI